MLTQEREREREGQRERDRERELGELDFSCSTRRSIVWFKAGGCRLAQEQKY